MQALSRPRPGLGLDRGTDGRREGKRSTCLAETMSQTSCSQSCAPASCLPDPAPAPNPATVLLPLSECKLVRLSTPSSGWRGCLKPGACPASRYPCPGSSQASERARDLLSKSHFQTPFVWLGSTFPQYKPQVNLVSRSFLTLFSLSSSLFVGAQRSGFRQGAGAEAIS